jgi:cytochrome P450
MTRRSTPPGPRGRELLRTIVGRRRDPIALIVELRERYGDLVHIRLGRMRLFIASDPAAVKHVLVDNHRNYTKGPAYELLAKVLGEGLVTSEGELWRRHRRIVQPAMHRDHMPGFVAAMTRATADEIRRLQPIAARGGETDVFPLTMELALRIVSRALLGTDIGGREADVSQAMNTVFDQIERLSASGLRVLEMLPGGQRIRAVGRRLTMLRTRRQRAFTEAIGVVDRVIYEVIDQRRRGRTGLEGDDLVASLLRARDDGGRALSDAEIRDEIMTMFIAGHETTATALAWSLHLLATHPSEQCALAQESVAVLGDRTPEVGDLPRLSRARFIFEEAMRLFPPVWRISRFATAADRVSGYDVPAGSVVIIYPYLIHRDPALWDAPERFDPMRFAPERAAGRDRLAYIPFGVGQRMCIGAAFATAEAQIALAMLSRAMWFERGNADPPPLAPRLTLRPKGGLPLRIHPARVAASSNPTTVQSPTPRCPWSA